MTTNQPGYEYLGPLSSAAILSKDEPNAVVVEGEAPIASDASDLEMAHQHPLTKSMRMQMTTEVLKCLRHFPIIQEVINILSQFAQACIVSDSSKVSRWKLADRVDTVAYGDRSRQWTSAYC